MDDHPQSISINNYQDKVSLPNNVRKYSRITELINRFNMLTEGLNIISKRKPLCRTKDISIKMGKPPSSHPFMDTRAMNLILNPVIIPRD